MVPNMMKIMGNSPAVLEAYLNFNEDLSQGVLSTVLREQIALVVAQENSCQYCLAAHTAIGGMAGLHKNEMLYNREGHSDNHKTELALQFAKNIVGQRGLVDESKVQELRNAGYTEEEIAEIVANVCLNLFTNYFNQIAATEVDFPPAPTLQDVSRL